MLSSYKKVIIMQLDILTCGENFVKVRISYQYLINIGTMFKEALIGVPCVLGRDLFILLRNIGILYKIKSAGANYVRMNLQLPWYTNIGI